MVRGLFTNKSVVNHLAPGIPAGSTIHGPTGEMLPLHQVAQRYAAAGESCVVLAGKRYGQGSSRDWAAKGLAILGVRAVLAASFERIHRTNLIGMGILPLRLPEGPDPIALGIRATDRISIEASLARLKSGLPIPVSVLRDEKAILEFTAAPEVKTDLEFRQLEIGGVVPLILSRMLSPDADRPVASSSAAGGSYNTHSTQGRKA